MQALNKPENTDNSHEAHPSLGKLTAEHAMKRLNHMGHWAAERKGKIRVVEFHEHPNGESATNTFWFETWEEALTHYQMQTTYADKCGYCQASNDETPNKVINPLGQWVCHHCYDSMNETMGDLFHYSQGQRWSL